MPKNTPIYTWITIGGALSFIPVFFIAGPWAGYLLGNYLMHRWGAPQFVLFICVGIGFAGSVREIIRIIRFTLSIEKKND